MATHAPVHARPRRRIPFDEHLPVDHKLNTVYRIGAGLIGVFLVVFGILGLINHIGFFSLSGDQVAGLNTNGTLSVLSIVVGAILLTGMAIGGNVASTLNMVFGLLFLLNGFLFLGLLGTDYNFLAFKIWNVYFSFVVGLLLMTFGMYGRVGSSLPTDNPYYRARHPDPRTEPPGREHETGTPPITVALPGGGEREKRRSDGSGMG
jgi:hypothetical protein